VKPTETVARCEHCDKTIVLKTPPRAEYYEKAQVHIRAGTILLPDAVVKARHRGGIMDNHFADLDGYYCGPACLAARIAGLLDVNAADRLADDSEGAK